MAIEAVIAMNNQNPNLKDNYNACNVKEDLMFGFEKMDLEDVPTSVQEKVIEALSMDTVIAQSLYAITHNGKRLGYVLAAHIDCGDSITIFGTNVFIESEGYAFLDRNDLKQQFDAALERSFIEWNRSSS